MFTVKASYRAEVAIAAEIWECRDFFSDIRNFIELMDGIESIRRDSSGTTHWTVRADIPLVGIIKQVFPVETAEDTESTLEWVPKLGEKENLLRYFAEFAALPGGGSQVSIEQAVELRRKSARELHLLAPLAGEALIGREMGKRVAEMIESFMQKAKRKLER